MLWSATSVQSSFVIDEASEAKAAGKLIPIIVDGCRPPLGFRDIQTLAINRFDAVADAILAAIEGKVPAYVPPAPRQARKLAHGAAAVVAVLAVSSVLVYALRKPDTPAGANYKTASASEGVEPVYKEYTSSELGVTFRFPNNILSLDTTQRKLGRLTLRDGEGRLRATISRTPLPDLKDVKLAQLHEKEQLERSSYTVTYMAPEREQNWKDWYVLSGLSNNNVFYIRRWLLEDSAVSIEFGFPKELGPLYDKLIPAITRQLDYKPTAPKIDP